MVSDVRSCRLCVHSVCVRVKRTAHSALSKREPFVLPIAAVLGDLRNEEHVRSALKGAQVVFHVASYGMTGKC